MRGGWEIKTAEHHEYGDEYYMTANTVSKAGWRVHTPASAFTLCLLVTHENMACQPRGHNSDAKLAHITPSS